jgi:methylase of polypeptide subunit release factors
MLELFDGADLLVRAAVRISRSRSAREGRWGTNVDRSDGGAVFQDRQESEFYAQCVRDFLFRHGYDLLESKEVVELGVGTGETIIELLNYHGFSGKIRGYEIHQESFRVARELVEANAVADRYVVVNDDFFDAVRNSVVGGCAISNPPYLPAPDRWIRMPELWGGDDGSAVTKQLLDCGFEQLILLISSFSDPLSIIEHASRRGYSVLDYAVRTMRFGAYTSEPKVHRRIVQLRREDRAFVVADRYCIAGVAWVRRPGTPDLAAALARAITSLDG